MKAGRIATFRGEVLPAFVLIAALGVAPVAVGATEGSGAATDVPIIVLVDDSGKEAIARTNPVVQEALLEIRDKMSSYGYDVKTEEGIAAVLDWNLAGRRDSTDLLRMVRGAKNSERPEFDIRAVVIFSVLGVAKDLGVMTEVEILISGSIYDAEAQRHLTRFGPYGRTFPAPAECGSLCVQSIGRPLAADVAAVVGDEARKELARLTKDPAAYPAAYVVAATPKNAPLASREKEGAPGTALPTTYAIHFEDFSTDEVFEVIEVMETEFPEYVQSRGIDGTPTRSTFGYQSHASAQQIYRWLNLLLMDMGMDPDEDVQVIKEGTHLTLRKLASPLTP